MRRRFVEIGMSIAALGIILLVLISFDSRVRDEFSLRWQSGPTVEAASAFGCLCARQPTRQH